MCGEIEGRYNPYNQQLSNVSMTAISYLNGRWIGLNLSMRTAVAAVSGVTTSP